MKLYLTHKGMMFLMQASVLNFPLHFPYHTSIFIKQNHYFELKADVMGRVKIDDVMGAYYDGPWDLTTAQEDAILNHTRIVGTVEYRKF